MPVRTGHFLCVICTPQSNEKIPLPKKNSFWITRPAISHGRCLGSNPCTELLSLRPQQPLKFSLKNPRCAHAVTQHSPKLEGGGATRGEGRGKGVVTSPDYTGKQFGESGGDVGRGEGGGVERRGGRGSRLCGPWWASLQLPFTPSSSSP